MGERQPALLVVLIKPSRQCWYVGGIALSGDILPLLRSEPDNLSDYLGLEFDAQLSFLRHRIAGVLQRGCDRLFSQNLKARHFLLIADGHFQDVAESLTERLAEHFVAWMVNPPVTYLLAQSGFTPATTNDLQLIAGEYPAEVARVVVERLPELVALLDDPDCWEVIARPQRQP